MFATRVCRLAVRLNKTSTGLVGLKVRPNARSDLVELYNKTFEKLKAFPADSAYRRNVEKITTFRLNAVQDDNLTEEDIQKKVGYGQLEEMIEQAEDELELIDKYYEWKLWEPPTKEEA